MLSESDQHTPAAMQQPNRPIADPQLAATITSLADKHSHKLLFFHSAACSLCRTLQAGPLQQLQGKAERLQLVPVCCDDQGTWAPEVRRALYQRA